MDSKSKSNNKRKADSAEDDDEARAVELELAASSRIPDTAREMVDLLSQIDPRWKLQVQLTDPDGTNSVNIFVSLNRHKFRYTRQLTYYDYRITRMMLTEEWFDPVEGQSSCDNYSLWQTLNHQPDLKLLHSELSMGFRAISLDSIRKGMKPWVDHHNLWKADLQSGQHVRTVLSDKDTLHPLYVLPLIDLVVAYCAGDYDHTTCTVYKDYLSRPRA